MTINEYITENNLQYGNSVPALIWCMLDFETAKTVKAYSLIDGKMTPDGWLYYNGSIIVHLAK